MLPATQFQLTNANDEKRKYTFTANIMTAPPADNTSWRVVISGDHQCSPDEACKILLTAMSEVRRAIEKTAGVAAAPVERSAPKAIEPGAPVDPTEGGIGPGEPEPVVEVDPDDVDEGPPADPTEGGIGEPEAQPPVANVGGVVVQFNETSKSADPHGRGPNWPRGDTF